MAKRYSSIRIRSYLLTMFSPSDLSKDAERTRLSCSSPRTPVFSILNQPLLAGIAVSRYVIKLGITIHNVFSWYSLPFSVFAWSVQCFRFFSGSSNNTLQYYHFSVWKLWCFSPVFWFCISKSLYSHLFVLKFPQTQ